MNSRKALKYCLMAMLGGFAGGCSAATSESLPTWYMAEAADVVVGGKLHVTPNPDAARDKYAEPLLVTMDVQKVLKGSVSQQKISLHYQAVADQDAQLESQLRSLSGKDAIVFAYTFPDRGYYIDLYFGEDRVIPSTPSAVTEITSNLKQGTTVASASDYKSGGDIEGKVTDAINSLASETESTKNDGINQLVNLGCAGVPFIIKHMRDSRPYHGDLALKPRDPNAFEGLMHYNAKTVYDALSHLLSYITGAYFNHSENFNSQTDRDLDYHGWQVYLAHLGSADLKNSPFACK